jgi:EAL domain-containing protein (putative c-di-GMP-specific phosphodiesterase class I)
VELLWGDAERFETRAAALAGLGVTPVVEGYRGLLPVAGLRSAGVTAAKLHARLTADATSSRFGMEYLRELLARGRIEGVAMTAQGVASRDDVSRLFELSCERAQGPHISRALALDDAQAVLAANRGMEPRATAPA